MKVAPAVGIATYRIAQESLRNVVRHAGVKEAALALVVTDGSLTLTVSDAGKGFAPGAGRSGDGLGLIAMRQRATTAGGHLAVGPRPGGGTLVTVTLPCGAAA